MGRHSRRGPVPRDESADIAARPEPRRNDRRDGVPGDGGDAGPDGRRAPDADGRRGEHSDDRRAPDAGDRQMPRPEGRVD
ncbi:hypothetical protein ABZ299_09085, partial [Streptomyces sp. NPDC006184]